MSQGVTESQSRGESEEKEEAGLGCEEGVWGGPTLVLGSGCRPPLSLPTIGVIYG